MVSDHRSIILLLCLLILHFVSYHTLRTSVYRLVHLRSYLRPKYLNRLHQHLVRRCSYIHARREARKSEHLMHIKNLINRLIRIAE